MGNKKVWLLVAVLGVLLAGCGGAVAMRKPHPETEKAQPKDNNPEPESRQIIWGE